jgi:hypothetical protein
MPTSDQLKDEEGEQKRPYVVTSLAKGAPEEEMELTELEKENYLHQGKLVIGPLDEAKGEEVSEYVGMPCPECKVGEMVDDGKGGANCPNCGWPN